MSDKKDEGGAKIPNPLLVLGILLALGFGGGIGLQQLGVGVGSFIESVGLAVRRYPQIATGIIAVIFIIMFLVSGKKDKGGDAGHH